MNEYDIRTRETIAVVGGGMTGITAAIELAKSDKFEVTLFERAYHLGGLSDYYTWNGITCDRFYHVILSTDTNMLEFIKEIGLEDRLFWRETKSGFLGDGKLVSMSSILDFIRFPFLSYWQKFRLGLGILYSSRIKDPSKLDKIYVRQWLTKVFGRRIYETIWEPLLRSKLGDARDKTSAAFIWATIKRLYGARTAENKQEKIGHIRGGYKTILEAVEKKFKELGVKICLISPVTKIETVSSLQNSTLRPHMSEGSCCNLQSLNDNDHICVQANGANYFFKKVLLTNNCPTVLNLIGNRDEVPFWNHMEKLEYLGVVCVFLVLSRCLSDFYVINLLDETLPFTGIIEATNVVSPEEVDGKHLVYLPKYITPTNKIHNLSDDHVIELFLQHLKKLFPDLSDNQILHRTVFRERHVQPLQELNSLERVLNYATPLDNVYLANTSMIRNTTLNNNAAITLGCAAADFIANETIS